MSLCIENGCYGTKKGKKFIPLSNCTLKFTQPIFAGDTSGYIGVATHKDGSTQRRFFFPYGNGDTCKSDTLTGVINRAGDAQPTTFQKRMFVNLPTPMLRGLLGELVDNIDIPPKLSTAVSIVGKNWGWEKEPIWVLNQSLAINRHGRQVDLNAHGLLWISHLVQGDNKNVAMQEEEIPTPSSLSTIAFDAMCHFMAGTLERRMFEDVEVDKFVTDAFSKSPEEVSIRADCMADGDVKPDPNFVSAFFLASQSIVIANYEEWQKVNGCCPLVVATGLPDSGKTSAGKVALACTGGYPKRFLSNFTDKGCARVAASTTMGFQADDPTEPRDLGNAAKRFFDAGTDAKCKGEFVPRCCPLFTVNGHVIDWLLKADRARLLDRILLIKFPQRQPCSKKDDFWARHFTTFLEYLPDTMAQVIRVGQLLHTGEGAAFLKECLEVAEEGLGKSSKGSRVASSWACGIFAARKEKKRAQQTTPERVLRMKVNQDLQEKKRSQQTTPERVQRMKMAECTTAISDDDILNHYKEVLAPYVAKVQLSNVTLSEETSSMAGPEMMEDFMADISGTLLAATGNTGQSAVRSFLRTDCVTNQDQTQVVAIRLRKLNEQLKRGGKEREAMDEGSVRDNIQKLNLGFRSSEQKFWSPSKGKQRPKGCVLIRRSLFPAQVLVTLDRAAGVHVRNPEQPGPDEQLTEIDDVVTGKLVADKEVQFDGDKIVGVDKEVQVAVGEIEDVQMIDKEVQVSSHHEVSIEQQLIEARNETKRFEDLANERAREIKFLQEQLHKQGVAQEKVESSDHDSDEITDQALETAVMPALMDVVVTPKDPEDVEVAACSSSRTRKRKLEENKHDKNQANKWFSNKLKCNLCTSDKKKNWVCCDSCQQWQHSSCAGLTYAEAQNNPFVCRDCT